MLPASNRMRRSVDFDTAVRSGNRAGRPTLVVHRSVDDDAGFVDGSGSVGAQAAIVGFVVSKAVGNAVTRNRVKRRLRALVSSRVEALPAGCRVVVRANPAAATATFDALGADLDSALRTVQRRSGVSSAR